MKPGSRVYYSKKDDDSELFETELDDFSTDLPRGKNRLYFYCDVNKQNVLTLNVSLRQITNNLMVHSIELSQEPADIFLHINSNGGSIFDGFIASDYIRKNKIPVNTIIDGAAASAATFMSIVGKQRLIHENSFMLIHQLSSAAWGNFSDLQDEIFNCNTLMTSIKNLYKQYTKIPSKKIDDILKHDVWFTAKDCVKFGLVDDII